MNRRRFLVLAGGTLAAARPARATIVPWSPYRLRLSNAHTGETFDGPYRDETGPLASERKNCRISCATIIPGGALASTPACLISSRR